MTTTRSADLIFVSDTAPPSVEKPLCRPWYITLYAFVCTLSGVLSLAALVSILYTTIRFHLYDTSKHSFSDQPYLPLLLGILLGILLLKLGSHIRKGTPLAWTIALALWLTFVLSAVLGMFGLSLDFVAADLRSGSEKTHGFFFALIQNIISATYLIGLPYAFTLPKSFEFFRIQQLSRHTLVKQVACVSVVIIFASNIITFCMLPELRMVAKFRAGLQTSTATK